MYSPGHALCTRGHRDWLPGQTCTSRHCVREVLGQEMSLGWRFAKCTLSQESLLPLPVSIRPARTCHCCWASLLLELLLTGPDFFKKCSLYGLMEGTSSSDPHMREAHHMEIVSFPRAQRQNPHSKGLWFVFSLLPLS